MKAIQSLRHLEWTLGIPRVTLRELAATAPLHYHPFQQRQGTKIRTIDNPDEQIKHVQKRVNSRILNEVAMPEYLHGGVRRRSPLSNVAAHLGQRCLIRLDVEDFFPSISNRHVFGVWREQLGFGRQVSSLLTRLTTYRFRLPQGAPTSTALANLVLVPVEQALVDRSAETGVVYTRFVDDIGVSGNDPRFMIQEVITELRAIGLRVNRGKLVAESGIMGPTRQQLLTGYHANCKRGPSVPRKKRNNVRVAIRALRHLDPASEAHAKALARVEGKINFIQLTNPGSATALRRYLERIA